MSNNQIRIKSYSTVQLSMQNESFFDKINDTLSIELENFTNILKSIDILTESNILKEEGTQANIIDKLQTLFKKAILFFKKIKGELYSKFINIAFKKTKEITAKVKKYKWGNPKLYEKVSFTYYRISDDSIDRYRSALDENSRIFKIFYDAYNNNDISKIKDIDINIDNPKMELESEKYEGETALKVMPSLIDKINESLDSSKNTIDEVIRNTDKMQSLLTEVLKSKDLAHDQVTIALSLIKFFKSDSSLIYKYINLCIKNAYLMYKELIKVLAIVDKSALKDYRSASEVFADAMGSSEDEL